MANYFLSMNTMVMVFAGSVAIGFAVEQFVLVADVGVGKIIGRNDDHDDIAGSGMTGEGSVIDHSPELGIEGVEG